MTLAKFLQDVVVDLQNRDLRFALAGGLVASIYRKDPRATKDVDILLFAEKNSEALAKKVIGHFNLEPRLLRKADLEGGPVFAIKRKSTPVCIVAGRDPANGSRIGLDILLPELPWASNAIRRAQVNKIDFGFGPIPCLTVEDILVAKFYAVSNQSTRFMDLDDIRAIFESGIEINVGYLCSQLRKLDRPLPNSLKSITPKMILRMI